MSGVSFLLRLEEQLTGPSSHSVPLNTALLALQTLEAGGLFSKSENSDYDIEYTALQGSLGMMSKGVWSSDAGAKVASMFVLYVRADYGYRTQC